MLGVIVSSFFGLVLFGGLALILYRNKSELNAWLNEPKDSRKQKKLKYLHSEKVKLQRQLDDVDRSIEETKGGVIYQ